jgi:hypothetical protein
MSLLPLFEWLAQTPVGAFMRASTYAFAIVEMVHLLALAILGGVILIVDLSLLGVGLKRQSASRIAGDLTPLFLCSLVVMAISGVLLLSEEALKCYYNPAFRAKMTLLAVALVFTFALHWRVIKSSNAVPNGRWSKPAAAVSLLLWLSVGLAGRAIGFI